MICNIYAISKDDMRARRPQIRDNERCLAISITDKDAAVVFDQETDRILPVVFNDVTPIAWTSGTSFTDHMKFMSTYDAQNIVRFIERHANSENLYTLFINCSAGINRSGSVAKFAYHYSTLTHEQFRADNPQIQGNDWCTMKLIEAKFEFEKNSNK